MFKTASTNIAFLGTLVIQCRGRAVTLTLKAADPEPNSSGVYKMRIKNADGSWTRWLPYERSKTWRLSSSVGKKTVYVQYMDLMDNVSVMAKDTITHHP
jgi:hypothetical protein